MKTQSPKVTTRKPTVRKNTAARKNDPLTNVSVDIVQMTPDMATKLLAQNTHNRKMKAGALDEYTEALQNGYWQFNGDPIRVTNEGKLLDGQHRLTAIANSGATVPMVLIKGIPEKAQMTIDLGAKRSYSDHLRLQGETDSVSLAAVVRLFATYKRVEGGDHWPAKLKISLAESDATLRANPELRDAATTGRKLYSAGFKLSTASIGVAYHVLKSIDSVDAQFFFDRAVRGTELFEDGATQPILKLREFATPRKIFEHRRAYVSLGGIFKSWNAFREGRKIVNAAPRFGGANPEKFPWPR